MSTVEVSRTPLTTKTVISPNNYCKSGVNYALIQDTHFNARSSNRGNIKEYNKRTIASPVLDWEQVLAVYSECGRSILSERMILSKDWSQRSG